MSRARGRRAGTDLVAGRYELGAGSGRSYRARDTHADGFVVVTFVPLDPSADPHGAAVLESALQRASGLRHEHIVPLLDFVRETDRYVVVESLVEAEPLDGVLRARGRLAPAQALHVARQLADALACAHEAGVVHGGLTPACVRVRPAAPPFVLLSGFAVAGAEADPRADIFALGLLLFEMIEGRPLSGPLLPRFTRIVPPGVSPLVARAVRNSPAERQSDMREVLSEIDACLRRIGQSATSAPGAVRRRSAVVVDDAVEERAGRPTFPARILGAPPAASRRRMFVPGAMLIAAVALVAAWASMRTPAPPVEPPPAAVEPAPEPAPPPPPIASNEPAPVPPVEEAVAAPPPTDTAAAPVEEVAPPAPNLAPRIVSRRPEGPGPISVGEGETIEFSARVTDDDPDGGLVHAWLVDGRPAGSRSSLSFVAPPSAAGSTHTVELQVSDRAGLKAPPVSWAVAVVPRMSAADVRGWLERAVSAWEGEGEAGRRVSIANETIETQGQHATVGFDRAEIDKRGKLLFARRESYALEKQPDGTVRARRLSGGAPEATPRATE